MPRIYVKDEIKNDKSAKVLTPIDDSFAREIEEKLRYEYKRKYGIRMQVSRSDSYHFNVFMYKPLNPQPVDDYDVEAEDALEKIVKEEGPLKFLIIIYCWDQSYRPDEKSYTRSVYIWYSHNIRYVEDIERFKDIIFEAEKLWLSEREKVRRELAKKTSSQLQNF